MSATAAIQSAADALRRNPVVFAGAATFAVLSLPSYALQAASVPLVPMLWSAVSFFVTPFLTGGLLTMAADALDGETSLSRFVAGGKEYYVPLLLVALVLIVVIGAIALFGGIALAVVGVFVFGISASGAGTPSIAAALVFALLVLAFVLVVLLVAFFLQFVNQAVVVGDDGPVDAVKHSYWTVRHNLVGAFGVAVFGFFLSGVLGGGPVMLATLALQSGPQAVAIPIPDVVSYAVLFGWGTFATVVFGAYVNTMLVAFYEAHGPDEDGTEPEVGAGTGTDADTEFAV